MQFIARLLNALDMTKSLWLWEAPYCDDSAMLTCLNRIDNHSHDDYEVGYICEDFDRDGYCWR